MSEQSNLMEEYNRHPGLNASALKQGLKSMAHMHWARTHQSKPSAAMSLGTLAHELILNNVSYSERVFLYESRRSGAEYKKACKENPGKIAVKPDEYEALQAWDTWIQGNKDLTVMLRGCKYETPIYWEHERYGLAKARLDGLTHGKVIEVKTTSKQTPREFFTQAEYLGYPIQYGWYWHAASTVLDRSPGFVVITLCTSAPYCVDVYELSRSELEEMYEEAVGVAMKYRCCEVRGYYPGPTYGVVPYERPAWASKNEEHIVGE